MTKFYLAFNPFVVIFQFTKWNRINVIAFFEPVMKWAPVGSSCEAMCECECAITRRALEGESCEFNLMKKKQWCGAIGRTAAAGKHGRAYADFIVIKSNGIESQTKRECIFVAVEFI